MKKKKYQIFQLSSPSLLHRILFYILFISNLLSLIYFLVLGFYNRLALDDYCYLTAQNEYGFLSPFTFWYQNYQGRFSPQFFINLITRVNDLIHSLFPFTILYLALFIGVIAKLVKKIAPILSHFEIINLSIFIFSVFVINNYEFHTFYWLNASSMYFGGVLFLLIGVNEILSPGINFWRYLLLIFSAIYVGSSSETFALIWSVSSGFVILFNLKKSKFHFRALIDNICLKKILLAFVLCFTSFIIMYMAPGNDVRLHITAINMHQQIPLSLNKLIPASINACFVFGFHTLTRFPYWILLSLPFFYLGSFLRQKIILSDAIKNHLKLISFCFVIFLLICLIPTVYVQGNMGPKRALTHIAFYITSYVVLISFVTGLKVKLSPCKFLWLGIISTSLWAFILIGRLKNDIPATKKYAQSEDNRLAYLKTLENKFVTDTVELDPLYLPVSSDIGQQLGQFGQEVLNRFKLNNSLLTNSLNQNIAYYPLQPNELRPLPQDFVNDCICRSFHLEFHLKLKPDSTKTNK